MTALPAAFRRRPREPRRRMRPGDLAVVLALVAMACLVLVPVYVMVAAGFKPPAQADASHMWELPKTLDFSGFSGAWSALGPNFQNSLMIAIPATVISAFIGAINGYVFAKMPFRGSNVIFMAMLLGMFIPYQVILVPLVRFLQEVHLYGTIPGLILVHVIYGIPITTLIFRNYYAAVPNELVEAARIDGADILGIYRHILFPISLPGFVVVMIWQFTSIWNEFLFAIVLTSNPQVQPIMVALNNLAGSYSVQWNIQMAGALMAAIPTLLVYVLLGRYFLRGLLAGSLKG
jgi:glucose/mannose transport system permease protein